MSRWLSRFWAWLSQLFDFDRRPPGYGRRETDGLPRANHRRQTADDRPPTASGQTPAPPTPPVVALPPTSSGLTAPPIAPELALETDEPPRYVKSKSVLTFQERRLYLGLLRAVENRYQILAKVRLADIVYLANLPRDSKMHRNRVLCKHVDFLICQPGTLAPLLVIELDDSSHAYPDHQARDAFKNELFAAVGLPLLRLKIQSGYTARYLREEIDARLNVVEPPSFE